jgi:hypothetical protein
LCICPITTRLSSDLVNRNPTLVAMWHNLDPWSLFIMWQLDLHFNLHCDLKMQNLTRYLSQKLYVIIVHHPKAHSI